MALTNKRAKHWSSIIKWKAMTKDQCKQVTNLLRAWDELTSEQIESLEAFLSTVTISAVAKAKKTNWSE
ncbi:hypothetical protein H8B09_30075 [Paenibacillus sp. PR3]|uniref:Uncharacterized protein n=1 Tax=Paenibacillus terricola TaxID=2763503 RepID=A0ABR8N476_9BACL|nr:hypothetical protein [Paenibacillus terricola]MBD3922977.1 hypothetical protein [Paenibacillus terricola]